MKETRSAGARSVQPSGDAISEALDDSLETSGVKDKAKGERVLVVECPGPRADNPCVRRIFLVLDEVERLLAHDIPKGLELLFDADSEAL